MTTIKENLNLKAGTQIQLIVEGKKRLITLYPKRKLVLRGKNVLANFREGVDKKGLLYILNPEIAWKVLEKKD